MTKHHDGKDKNNKSMDEHDSFAKMASSSGQQRVAERIFLMDDDDSTCFDNVPIEIQTCRLRRRRRKEQHNVARMMDSNSSASDNVRSKDHERLNKDNNSNNKTRKRKESNSKRPQRVCVLPGSLLLANNSSFIPSPPVQDPPIPSTMIRFLLLGPPKTGKTSIARRFIKRQYIQEQQQQQTNYSLDNANYLQQPWSVEYYKKDISYWNKSNKTTGGRKQTHAKSHAATSSSSCARVQLWDTTGGYCAAAGVVVPDACCCCCCCCIHNQDMSNNSCCCKNKNTNDDDDITMTSTTSTSEAPPSSSSSSFSLYVNQLVQKPNMHICLVLSLDEQDQDQIFQTLVNWKRWIDHNIKLQSITEDNLHKQPFLVVLFNKVDLLLLRERAPFGSKSPLDWIDFGRHLTQTCLDIGIDKWFLVSCLATFEFANPTGHHRAAGGCCCCSVEDAFMKLIRQPTSTNNIL